jgi:hypothetical protein
MKEIHCEFTNEITCPYCGFEHGDSWEWYQSSQDEWHETECDGCEKTFEAIRIITVDYSSRKSEDTHECLCTYV